LKTGDLVKRASAAFVLALAAYAVLYYLIEHRRASKGPWQVTFTKAEIGVPAMLINQSALGITNVQILFQAEPAASTNAASRANFDQASPDRITVSFNQARQTPFDVPYGRCDFLDTVTLPGTVAFEIFGHQIQLMPRVLTIDGIEHSWKVRESFMLTIESKCSTLAR